MVDAVRSVTTILQGHYADGQTPGSINPTRFREHFLSSLARVASIAELRTIPATDGQVVFVAGYYTAGDGGGGPFAFDAAAAQADDGGLTVRPTAVASGSPGRWKRVLLDSFVTPEMFGAQADDTRDCQPAFLAAASSGRTVRAWKTLLPYRLASPLTLPADAALIAEGKPVLHFAGNMTPHCVGTSGDRVTFKGFVVDAEKSSKSGTCNGIFLTNNSAEVEGNEVRNANSQGVKVTGDRNKVRRNIVTGSNGPNIQVLGPTVLAAPGAAGGSYNDITDNDVTGGLGFGIHLDDAAHDNSVGFNRCTLSGLELIGSTYSCYRNQIIGNHAEGTGDNGISVTGYNTVIAGNECVANANSGIHCYGSFNTVTGNVCLNNNQSRLTAPTNTFAGIDLGASWGGLGSYNTVAGNTCDDNQATATQEYGIAQTAGFYPAWAAGISLTYPYISVGLNIYKRVAGATVVPATGAAAPSHTAGDVNDGTITWRFVAAADTNLNGKRNAIGTNTCRGNRTKSYFDQTGNSHTVVHEGQIVLDAAPLGGSSSVNLPLQIIAASGSPATLALLGTTGDLMLRRGGSTGITGYLKEGGASDSTQWVPILTRKSGTNANRPTTLGIGYEGYVWHDQTYGQPAWWDGARYRDAMGNTPGLRAAKGDVSPTLTVGTDPPLQVFGTPLTANRTITLATANALNGNSFKVVRTYAATGNFTLDLGGLKTLRPGQWAEVVYDSTAAAWALARSGYLGDRGRGALLSRTTAGAGIFANATPTAVPWEQANFDTDAIWSGVNPTRLTVPAGVTRIRLSGSLRLSAAATATSALEWQKNGGGGFIGGGFEQLPTGLAAFPTLTSALLDVAAGDYFELFVTQNTGAAAQFDANLLRSFASMEIVR